MFKYQRKPSTVEAVQHFSDMGTKTTAIPQWLIQAVLDQVIMSVGSQTFVNTNHGPVEVIDGDWIINNGSDIYPCKDELFQTLYEPVP